MKNFVIQVPQTQTSVIIDGKTVYKNRYLTNLAGAIDIHSAQKPLSESVELFAILKEIKIAESTMQLILPEASYSKLKQIVASTKGWGNVTGQVELLETTNSAKEQ